MSDPRKRRWPKRLLVLTLLVIGVACGGWYYWQNYSVDAPEYRTVTVSRGDLVQAVTASGQLDPVVKVEVGSQISGNIKKLSADFNSTVKEGQIIAQLDPASYEATVITAEGNLASAKAGLELARVSAARATSMRASKLSPEADYDKAMADLHQAEAAVTISEGALKKAQVDLARCTIYAPIDGMVVSRNVNVGQTVAASLSAPVLFVIANDLSKMQIEAKVAEADVGQVEVGQDADFNVDAFPSQIFHGKVAQVRNAPNMDQNVVTYDTIIEVSNPGLKLKPGMTANVSIIIAHRDNALKVPNAALRFRPPEVSGARKAGSTSNSGRAAIVAEKSTNSDRKKDKRKAERTVYVRGLVGGSTNFHYSLLPQPVQIKTGTSDGSQTEVVQGLNEGDEVIIGMTTEKERATEVSSLFTASRKKK